MSKVAILSFPRYYNYGTFLQMFALQQTVAGMGYEPELIDYDPFNDSGRRRDRGGPKSALLTRLRRSLRALHPRKHAATLAVDLGSQKALFTRFLAEDLRLGARTYFNATELEADPPAASAVIVGSDQVWNPLGHREDAAYFLGFAPPRRRIAYAPSFGVSALPDGTAAWLSPRVVSIPHLSVREQAGADIVRRLTGRDAEVVLDPVYLVDADAWSTFAGPVDASRPRYLLCYFLESDRYMRERALDLASTHGLEPLMIPVHPSDRVDDRFVRLADVGPREFVRLVRDAALVCTDSFHGTSFSLVFNRPFLTFRRYDNPEQAANHSRLASILQAAGLQDRVVGRDDVDTGHRVGVDFADANARLARLRDHSRRFLAASLAAATAA